MRKSKHHSLSNIISITFLSITLVSLLVSGTFQILFYYRTQTRAISEKQNLIANKAADDVKDYVADRLYKIKSALVFSGADLSNPVLMKDLADSLLSIDPSFRNVAVIDLEKDLVSSSSRQSTRSLNRYLSNINFDNSNEAITKGRDIFSHVIIDEETNEPLIEVYIPWVTLLKEVKGAVSIEINLKFMWDIVYSLNVGETGETYVIDQDGRILASRDSGRVIRNENLIMIPIVKEFLDGSKHNSIGMYKGLSGHRVVGEYIALQELGWAVITEMHIVEAYRDVIITIIISVSVILILSIAVVFIGIKMSKSISLPIMKLTTASKKIANGHYEVSIPVMGSYEIAELTESLNLMALNLKSKINDLDSEIKNRQSAEKELYRAKKYISNIINSMPSQIIGVSTDLTVTQWNLETEKVTGINENEALGKKIDTLIPSLKKDIHLILEAIENKTEQGHYKLLDYIDGNELYKDIIIYPLIANGVQGAVIRIDNISEKVMLEELIIQSEKMMYVGGMAAGMAHEINNPLAGIMQISEVMQNRLNRKIELEASLRVASEVGVDITAIKKFLELRGIPKMLDTIHDSCMRVSAIVHNMLTFSRKEKDEGSFYYITEILDNCIELASIDYDLKRDFDFKKIKIIKEYEENVPKVKCNKNKIQQVFMNIFKNGAEAMIDSTKRNKSQFTIRCRYIDSENLVNIEIEDNGPGMDHNTKKKIFEPFFTTKGMRKGTGLGLSVSFFIITETHKGKMFVKSQKGKGSKFIIQLPVSSEDTN